MAQVEFAPDPKGVVIRVTFDSEAALAQAGRPDWLRST
jgi:hypothetical protein